MMDKTENLKKFAQVAIKVGLNLQPGQKLIIRAPIETIDFVRELARTAYQAGARLVDVQWLDEELRLIRHKYAPRDSFEEISKWPIQALLEAARAGDAVLRVHSENPDLLKDQDAELVSLEQKIMDKHMEPFRSFIGQNKFNWTIVSAPTFAWARKVFPNESEEILLDRMWEVIFHTTRLKYEDPVQHWQEHAQSLKERALYLNKKQYEFLHYKGPGTDLKIGLPKGHIWQAADMETKSGIRYIANMPTEEIFTAPHRNQVEGIVSCSKPLNYAGNLIHNFTLRFEKGRVVEVRAEEGGEVLEKLIKTDEGSARLGEVALVPHSSPISQSGLIFYNTLFDENAASHIALGKAYAFCIKGGEKMSKLELKEVGLNDSLVHVDFMIGSDKLDIDGETKTGILEPIMRQGEWAFVLN